MPSLFNTLSRFIIAYFPQRASFNFMAAVTIWYNLGAQENKVCHYFHCFPICLPWDWMLWSQFFECWVLSQLLQSSLTFIKRLFSSSSLSAVRVMSSTYLMLLIFLPAIFIQVWASSNLAFHVMYSAFKLNKQDDDIYPWWTPFAILNQFVVPCPVLTVASFFN